MFIYARQKYQVTVDHPSLIGNNEIFTAKDACFYTGYMLTFITLLVLRNALRIVINIVFVKSPKLRTCKTK